jgi:O-antigen/teichoic acid export membrane protein
VIIRNSAAFVLGRGLPGVVAFAALTAYSRLLSPSEYGLYAMTVAAVAFVHAASFQWLQLVALRYCAESEDLPGLLGHMLAIFGILAAVALAGAGIFWYVAGEANPHLVVLGGLLLILHAWMELNLNIASGRMQLQTFGALLAFRNIVAFGIGVSLCMRGWGAAGPITGLLVGACLSTALFTRKFWRGVRPVAPNAADLRGYLSFGMPLSLTFVMSWVTASSDRLIIAVMIGAAATGSYAVSYDLAQQPVGLLLITVQTAAYPLAITALGKGADAASRQVRKSAELLCAVAVTAGISMAIMAEDIASVVLGSEFRDAAAEIIPWITAAAVLGGIKAYHFDMAFHLSKQTRWLAVSVLIGALTNIVLNVALIPAFGVLGAAYATVAATVLALLFSALFGRRVYRLPPFLPLVLRIAPVVVAGTGGLLLGGHAVEGPAVSLVVAMALCVVFSSLAAFAVNLAGVQDELGRGPKRGRHKGEEQFIQ